MAANLPRIRQLIGSPLVAAVPSDVVRWCRRVAVGGLLGLLTALVHGQQVTLTPSATSYAATGGTLTFTATFTYPTTPTALGLTVNLPPGWSYAGGLNEPGVAPFAGATGTLDWAYTENFGSSSSTFAFSVTYPAGLAGTQTITASAYYRTPLVELSVEAISVTPIPVGGYATWSQTRFTVQELTLEAVSGAAADPDGDGWSNLMEYALGLEPKTPDVSALPALDRTASDWSYTYHRPADRPDLSYEVEVSTNLTLWGTGGITHERIATGTIETWRATYPLASASNVFIRLKVTQN